MITELSFPMARGNISNLLAILCFRGTASWLSMSATHVEVTERVRAQEQAEKVRQLELDLAHMNCLSIMGELTASLSYEICIRSPPRATMRECRSSSGRSPPDLGEVGDALSCIVRDAD